MLSGDFATMALADVLQWADAARASGLLTIQRASGRVWLSVSNRHVRLTGLSPTQPVRLDQRLPADIPNVSQAELALEHLYDQFLDSDAAFTFDEAAAPPEPGVELEVFLPELLMEGMRLLDEWPRLDKLYQSDSPQIHLGPTPLPETLPSLKRALVACAHAEMTLSVARLTVGLSRPAFLRRLDELRALEQVRIDGTPEGGDLIAKLVSQATVLLAAKQFEEAAHVFAALLGADPGATRVKSLLQRAETEQLEFLRSQLPGTAVPAVARHNVDRRNLTKSDLTMLDLVNGSWEVAVLVLSSPLREKESLKSLVKLLRLGVIELRRTG